jgi:phage shock protein C
MNRRLYRCRHDRRLAGVAAGVAEYFDLDPTLVRVLWFVSIFFGGLGLLLYIGMAIIVPIEPLAAGATVDGHAATGSVVEPEGHRHASRGDGRWTTFFGLVLVLLGSLALVDSLLPSWQDAARYLGPAFVIGLGILIVVTAIRREPSTPSEPMET